MKHQVTLVGAQLLPIYIGIKEFNPDTVHFVVSNESKKKLGLLRPLIPSNKCITYTCDAYDFEATKNICENVVGQLGVDDQLVFNLTGGTKVMVLAAFAVIHKYGMGAFYINQDDTLLEIPSYEIKKINVDLSIKEFFDLSGHSLHFAKHISDYTKEDFEMAQLIEKFSITDRKYTTITSHVRKTFQKSNRLPSNGKEVIGNGIELTWNTGVVQAVVKGQALFQYKSPHIIDLFFNSAWWELLVAQEVSKWTQAKEVLVKCELPFKSDAKILKNEIDVLVNLGNKLVFIECKSGIVKQEDINKMKVIKETYGGAISKSMLVSRYFPNKTIVEKCKELSIDIFWCYSSQSKLVNRLNRLPLRLNALDKKPST